MIRRRVIVRRKSPWWWPWSKSQNSLVAKDKTIDSKLKNQSENAQMVY